MSQGTMKKGLTWMAAVLLALVTPGWASGSQPPDRPADPDLTSLREEILRLQEKVDRLEEKQEETDSSVRGLLDGVSSRFTFGGYGEIHANFAEGSDPDLIDIHRLVAFLGYEFAEWIRLSSETELEHAFVSNEDEGDGELVVEQLFIDFLLCDAVNIRFGRMLTPLGIINQNHEPPTFNGVERPTFANLIIPSTWSSDGVGIFGDLASNVTYELSVVGGLDGSKFSDTKGIRDGRISGRPSLHEPAFTGRVDVFPLLNTDLPPARDLRLGASFYQGGLDNGNKGVDPGVNGDIAIYSGDGEVTLHDLDFRGVVAYERIRNAGELGNGTAQALFGAYLEAGLHVWPAAWRTERFARTDLVVFVRRDWIDTQNKMPSGVVRNEKGQRTEWTTGVTWLLTPGLVVKADVQFRNDRTSEDLSTLFNLGVGWIF